MMGQGEQIFMLNTDETLRTLGFPENLIPEMSQEFGMSYALMPDHPEMLSEGELREMCAFCSLDPMATEDVLRGADLIRKTPELKAFLWHIVFTLTRWRTMYNSFPLPEKHMGDLAGTFYLIAHLAARKIAKARYLAGGYPLEVVQETLSLADQVTEYRKQTGFAGTSALGLSWNRRYLTTECFRLGRFEYFIANVANQPTVLENRQTSERVILQEDSFEKGVYTGKKVLQKAGITEEKACTFSEKEWKKILCQGDCVLSMHIPAGGGMTPERSLDSLKRAFAFFRTYFPGKFYPAVVCKSWIGNPQFLELLPESNIAKLMRNARLFPLPSSGVDGLAFIFGMKTLQQYGEDYAKYPHDNSVRRAMLSVLERGDRLRLGGMIFFEDELDQFVLQ